MEDLFAERIHRGDDFVDVKKMKEEDNADKAVTGTLLITIIKIYVNIIIRRIYFQSG